MIRFLNIVLACTSIVTFIASCASEAAVVPRQGLEIAVDSEVYHLQPIPGGYTITLTATVINSSDRDVFLSQQCGSWQLGRANEEDKTHLYLGEYGCIEEQRLPPLTILAGNNYSRTFKLTGSNSPQTRPPITIENNTGTLVFSYFFTDPTGTKFTKVRSSPFTVVPPS